LYLSAESLQGTWNGPEKWFGCKIHESNHVFSAYARVIGISGTKFDLVTIGRDEMAKKGTIRVRVNRFANVTRVQLEKEMTNFRDKNPAIFAAQNIPETVISNAVFVGFENGRPKLFLRWFVLHIVHDKIVAEIKSRDCPGDCESGTAQVAMGFTDIIDHEIQIHPDIWEQRGFPEGIKYLIQAEAGAHPDDVGGPIAVLMIDSAGPRWIDYGSCKP
jgi:hypothetical protein